METISEKTQLDTKQRPENGGETLPNEYMCSTAPASVAQGTSLKREMEILQAQGHEKVSCETMSPRHGHESKMGTMAI